MRNPAQGRPKRIFQPSDFAHVLAKVPETCPLVGGQAVAWWAQVFNLDAEHPLTSSDIDFWGFREDLEKLSQALDSRPVWPHQYEMTVWVGGLPIVINDERTLVDFISSVPGLDVIYPEKASVEGQPQARENFRLSDTFCNPDSPNRRSQLVRRVTTGRPRTSQEISRFTMGKIKERITTEGSLRIRLFWALGRGD